MGYYGIDQGRLQLTIIRSYPSITCAVTIVAPSINDRLMFYFGNVDIRNSISCSKDSLQLFDAPNINAPRPSGNTLTLLFTSISMLIFYTGFDAVFTAYHIDCHISGGAIAGIVIGYIVFISIITVTASTTVHTPPPTYGAVNGTASTTVHAPPPTYGAVNGTASTTVYAPAPTYGAAQPGWNPSSPTH
ncbi:hypothetical protein ACJMK2_011242 [Sinanodonta woodiana]|uniref:Uncharacterized protein n=1 Tax=Sinanodonta woodiana TaxID=1069815 RepID=A0ABD3V4B1_SINWO